MTDLSPSLSLIKELDDIYQALIAKECFPLALKALELKAKLLPQTTQSDVSLAEMISKLADSDLDLLVKRLTDNTDKK